MKLRENTKRLRQVADMLALFAIIVMLLSLIGTLVSFSDLTGKIVAIAILVLQFSGVWLAWRVFQMLIDVYEWFAEIEKSRALVAKTS